MCGADSQTMLNFNTDVSLHSTSHLQQAASRPDHWWKDIASQELCPLTGFPLSLLPYPPFRFRLDPNNPENCQSVDAKYLVLQVIASGNLEACGRNLVDSDVVALDQHMRRCNLGRFRLSNLIKLQKDVAGAQSSEERALAQQVLLSEQENARKQFRKLQHIQNHRLKDMKMMKKTSKKKTKSQNRGLNRPEEKVSEAIALANLCTEPRIISWADASHNVAARLMSPNINLSWLENLQRWRSSTESAKGDEIMSRRMENASWRLWAASGADPSVTMLCGPDFLAELDTKAAVPQLKLTSSVSRDSEGRGRQPHNRNSILQIEEFSAGKSSEVLYNWRVSTKDSKVVVIDGQARSRRENQLWRLMAISPAGDGKSQAIIQKICAGNPTLTLQLGAQSPLSSGVTLPVCQTPSSSNFASHPLRTPSPAGRTWLRTPSPEFRWAADARPTPILAPRVPTNRVQNQGYRQPCESAENPWYQAQHVVVVPAAMPQVVGLMVSLRSGVCMQPVANMPNMTVPMPTPAISNPPLCENYACVAIPKHLVPQIQEKLGQPRQ